MSKTSDQIKEAMEKWFLVGGTTVGVEILKYTPKLLAEIEALEKFAKRIREMSCNELPNIVALGGKDTCKRASDTLADNLKAIE